MLTANEPSRRGSTLAPRLVAALAAVTLASVAPADPPARGAVDSPDWLGSIGDGIERLEYHFTGLAAERVGAPDRAQDLRSSIDAEGLVVRRRSTSSGCGGEGWTLGLRTARVGVDGVWAVLSAPALRVHENRVELDHGVLVEWFVNDPRGIEHGWTVREPLSGGALLQLEVGLAGELFYAAGEDPRSAVLVDTGGTGRLRYGGLRAWDATGRELDAWLLPRSGGFAVAVATSGAAFPLTVDPLLCGVDPPLEGNQSNSWFGFSVASAGDVNGDGHDDVIVGAPHYDASLSNQGRVFVFHGSASGVDSTPDWSAEVAQQGANLGQSVSSAGDLNGDGYDDVVVSAPLYDSYMVSDWGRAFVAYGSASGLGSLSAGFDEGHTSTSAPTFGGCVSKAGDVNGDGYDDVIVGVPGYSPVGVHWAGAAFVYNGSPAGLVLTPAWAAVGTLAQIQLGNSVAGAGDVDHDGYDDVVIGCENYLSPVSDPGRVYVYHGSSTGLGTSSATTLDGPQNGCDFGHCVAGAGDVNGDTYDDIVVGAPGYDNGQSNEGGAYVYLGSPQGIAASASWHGEGNQADAAYGQVVAGAGDVDGDGYDDLLVGVPYYDNGQTNEGRVYAFTGSSQGIHDPAAWTAEADHGDARFGFSLACAGDVNGDTYDDVIVGAWNLTGDQSSEGLAFLYHGHDEYPDCNENCVPDADDIAFGTSLDCNSDGVPDECQLGGNDCNGNGVPDDCELAGNDCNSNGVPDECEFDCDGNGLPDDCDIAAGAPDADGNGVIDGCEVGTPYCFGDGTGAGCPCGNYSSSAGRGCANSAGDGAILFATGTDSISAADLTLYLDGMPPSMPCLFFQARNQLSGITFGDGFQCAGGQLIRLMVRWADGDGFAYSVGDIAAKGMVVPGDTRQYQAWYRDPAGPCGHQCNTSNATSITWTN